VLKSNTCGVDVFTDCSIFYGNDCVGGQSDTPDKLNRRVFEQIQPSCQVSRLVRQLHVLHAFYTSEW
jgi:hypothetical protein